MFDFFLAQDFSQCQLSAGFAQKATCGGMGFTVSLSLLQVGIGGWLKLQMGLADMLSRNPGRNVRIRRWNLLIRFTSILIDDLSLSLSLQGLVQLLSSAIWSFKGPGPVDSMAGFAWLNFIFPLYLQHEVLRTSLGYTKDDVNIPANLCYGR